ARRFAGRHVGEFEQARTGIGSERQESELRHELQAVILARARRFADRGAGGGPARARIRPGARPFLEGAREREAALDAPTVARREPSREAYLRIGEGLD